VTVAVADEVRRRHVEYDEVPEVVLVLGSQSAALSALVALIKSLEDSTIIRAYPAHGPWGTSHGIRGAILHRSLRFGHYAHRRNGLALMS
jgi:hypothetical protein